MKKFVIAIIVLLMITLPYIFAATIRDGGAIFDGFLLNPKDGNSYLAKMYQGFRGEWLFTLPFSIETGKGHPLFTFYLFLGHLARWLRLDLILVFHLARIGASAFLLWSLDKLAQQLFPESLRQSDLFYLLVVLGSGMGWSLAVFGVLTSDFWVAEAYPFLAMYINPHFPLGLGLLVWLFILSTKKPVWNICLKIASLAILLSIILPFGIVIVGLVLIIKWLWDVLSIGSAKIPLVVISMIPGGIWVFVQYLLTIRDPFLKIWNAQNITPAPVIWDWIISFSPALILMFFALNRSKLNKPPELWKDMLIWIATATIIQAIPLNLQRRFLLGFYIPLVAFAVQAIFLFSAKVRKLIKPALILLSIPTNILILTMAVYAAQTHSEELYLAPGEQQAYEWIQNHTETDAVILSNSLIGGRIPGRTGRRVVYGHEFETINSTKTFEEVTLFFDNPTSQQSLNLIQQKDVDFIIVGPDEEAIINHSSELGRIIFSSEKFIIIEIDSP